MCERACVCCFEGRIGEFGTEHAGFVISQHDSIATGVVINVCVCDRFCVSMPYQCGLDAQGFVGDSW